jgi:hypothetical protein
MALHPNKEKLIDRIKAIREHRQRIIGSTPNIKGIQERMKNSVEMHKKMMAKIKERKDAIRS